MIENQALVVWADLGLLTGLAWYDLEKDVFGSGQYNNRELRDKLDKLSRECDGRMVIGYEKFIVTSGGPRTSTPEHALRAEQVVIDFSREASIPLQRPQPSSARKLGQVVFLRRLGWYRPGQAHANDAAQHVLADLLKRKPIPPAVRGKLFPGYSQRGTLAP